MLVPRPAACICRLSQLTARLREAADAEAACLAGLALVLALAAYYR